jgi:neutral ceramidase
MRALGLSLVAAAALCALLVVPACGPKILLPAPVLPPSKPPAVAQPAQFRVGTARVDITPPPGVTTFGHGPDSLVSEGYWTRIYCRVFVIEPMVAGADPLDERIALVPCDLSASSKVLHRTVAAAVTNVVKTTRIFLSATHTHAGPAHYFDEQGYDSTESSEVPGYDQHMVDFLAARIGAGIGRAANSERWAELRSWHYEREETCNEPHGECGTWGLAWNRSPKAHMLDGVGFPANAPAGLCPIEQMVDPSLHVMRFDEVDAHGGRGAPIGEIVSFAMHPTVLPNTNRLIGADSAGALSRILERRLRAEASASADPLAAVINTNEGDMSPAWKHGTKQEVVDIATSVAKRVSTLTAKPAAATRSAAIDARYAEVGLPDRRTQPDGGRTCDTAEVGVAVPYGACDHPTTTVAGLPMLMNPDDHECQAPKLTPLGPLERWLAGGSGSFPQRVPLGVVRIGDNVIGFVPAELTIEAGRIADAAMQAGLKAPAHVWVGGLTNGYILYVTTPDEYSFHDVNGNCTTPVYGFDRQSYEGGNTLYGPQTIHRLADVLGRLAKALDDENEATWLTALHELDTAGGTYNVWPNVPRFPTTLPEDTNRGALVLCRVADGSVCFEWRDATPGGTAVMTVPETKDWTWVSVAQPSGAPIGEGIDDRGTSLVTRARTATGSGEMIWATVWKPTAEEEGVSAAFRINDRSGAHPLVSAPFTAKSLAPCMGDPITACGTYENETGPSPLPAGCH